MATSSEIKQRANALAEKTDVNSITPREVGGIMYDLASHSENVLRNGGTLGIRKVYTSIAEMEADKNLKDFWDNPLKKENLVVIYDGTKTGVDNNKIYAYMNPGWQLATDLDAGYVTRSELNSKIVQETGDSEALVMSQKAVTREVKRIEAKSQEKVHKKVGKNLFNEKSSDIVDGYFIHKDGYLASNQNYIVSEFIAVKPDTNYYLRNFIGENVNWQTYDKDLNVLTTSNAQAIQTESSAKYIRVSVLKTDAPTQQLEEGTSFTSYEPYIDNLDSVSEKSLKDGSVSYSKMQKNSIGERNLMDGSVSFDKIGFVKSGKNLLNKKDKDVAVGYFIKDDSLGYNAAYITSGFFKVEEGKTYRASYNGNRRDVNRLGYYDIDKKFIKVTEGGVYDFVVPEGVAFARISILNEFWDYLQVEEGDITPYEEYYAVIPKELLDTTLDINEVSTENVKDGAVTPNKTSFFKQGKNLVDIKSGNVGYGKYISSSGALFDNAEYNTTDFISVESGKTYSIGASDTSGIKDARILAVFNGEYKIIDYLQNVTKVTIIEGGRYIRASLYVNGWDYAQISEGENRIPYEKFATIDSDYLPNTSSGGEAVDVLMYVPKHIYVAAGRTIELYYEQIVLNAHKYNIQATCQIGKALDRKYQLIGDANKIGDYPLTIKVVNDNGNVVVSDTGIVHIVNNTVSDTCNVVPFGDSLTNEKPWLKELGVLSSGKIVTKGTRNGKHEGRSGANVSNYLSKTGGLIYSYDSAYSGVGNDSPIFDASASYQADDLVRYPSTFGTGESGYQVYAFKRNHSGAWNESDVVCISGGNPLYDYKNNKISLNWYKSFQNIQCDIAIIYLGTNGISLSPEKNINGSMGIKNLIDEIRKEDTTTPIIVVNTIFKSSQNGIGNQGNTDGYKAQSAFKFEEDKKVLLLAKSINEMVGSYDNVYIAPVGATHDSKYNFGNRKIAVNPRLESTESVYELQPYDSVHPQDCGYYQMADTIYSTICAIINK